MKTIKNVANIILIGFVLIVSAALILSTIDTPLNVKVYNVTSGSMEPRLPLGSLIVTKTSKEYSEGDIITFKQSLMAEETFTHRVVGVEKDTDKNITYYRTKGDANQSEDINLTPQARVLGKVILTVPYAGRALEYTKTPTGFVVLVGLPATLIIYSELGSIKEEITGLIKDKKKGKKLAADEKE